MFDFFIGLLELFTSSIWGPLGLLLGFIAAFSVWHLAASSPAQTELAALAYVVVFVISLVFGWRNDPRR